MIFYYYFLFVFEYCKMNSYKMIQMHEECMSLNDEGLAIEKSGDLSIANLKKRHSIFLRMITLLEQMQDMPILTDLLAEELTTFREYEPDVFFIWSDEFHSHISGIHMKCIQYLEKLEQM